MFDEIMIPEDRFYPQVGYDACVRLKIRLPWYRSFPLSCVKDIALTIDGNAMPRQSLSLGLYGQAHTLDQLADLHDVQWFILDAANLLVDCDRRLGQGQHRVEMKMTLRIPYSDNMAFEFTEVAHCTKTLALTAEDGV